MKVVLINTYYGIGSTGKIVESYHKYLKKNGMQVYPCCAIVRDSDKSNVYQIGTRTSQLIHKVETYVSGNDFYHSKKATVKLIQYIDSIAPDIICLHNIHGFYIEYNLLFEYIISRKIPVIWTFHDFWPITGKCGHFFDIGCIKWEKGCADCPRIRSYPRSLFFDRAGEMWINKKRLYSEYDGLHIVTVSRWLAQYLNNSFLSSVPLSVIYNGVDTSIFYPRNSYIEIREKLNLNGKKIVLGVASGWTERKGIDDFLKISALLPANTVIVLVGKYNKKDSLPGNVFLYGSTSSQDELAELYSAADVFVNPSRQETFGLTTAEAMACGTIPIAYNVTATPEIVGNKYKSEFLAKAYDVDDLLLKIERQLMNQKQPMMELANRINEVFGLDNNQRRYLELINTIMHE